MIWHQVMAQDPGHLWLREQLMALGKDMGIMNDLSA
jgi:hypothetical protein